MPFFLATASPVFGGSALTICGLAGATGATNAVVLESIISGSNRQRMVDPSFRYTLWQCSGGIQGPVSVADNDFCGAMAGRASG